MPVDASGRRAEMIFDHAAVSNRMIPARLNEHIINAAAGHVYFEVVKILGVKDRQRQGPMRQALENVKRDNPQAFQAAWDYLLGFYEITVPRQARMFREQGYGSSALSHLTYVLHKGYMVLYMRSDHELEMKNMVADIQRLYPPTFSTVKYRGASGNIVETVEPIRIAPLSIIMLEKLGDSWAAVASARRQHHGVHATLSNADKYSERIRMQPTKAYGESEMRIVISYSGALTAAEILDRNNSIETHKAMCWAIMDADKPTCIAQAVDRNVIPLDGSRSLQTVNHVWACSGKEMYWEAYRPTHQPPPSLHLVAA